MKIGTSPLLLTGALLALAPAVLAQSSSTPVFGGTLKIVVYEAPVCVDPIQITNFTPLNIARNFAISDRSGSRDRRGQAMGGGKLGNQC